ncbi:hypothetical protein MTBBW1_1170014 [Desulfamplus magnetovallimortis]|uniref:Uncharacterized protein n=1 Tax=Desulfamplus magnetovallimortis TaxID=1246637 RepID=A0A1W1H5W4_9BACT|nr:hypothetical protein MTBBW1_1170014 [Desulfamplus magnetovallimortis]
MLVLVCFFYKKTPLANLYNSQKNDRDDLFLTDTSKHCKMINYSNAFQKSTLVVLSDSSFTVPSIFLMRSYNEV